MAEQLALLPMEPLEARLHAYVGKVLPPGVPSYVRQVAKVRETRDGIIADLVVFDGGRHTVEFRGDVEPSGHSIRSISMRWLAKPGDWPPFGWDRRRKRWVRYPEDDA